MQNGAQRTKGLSMYAAIAFAVGNMVGAGVFVLSGLIVGIAGPSAVFSYLLCGLIVVFSALSYATLASIYPEDGGGYLYARRILGPIRVFSRDGRCISASPSLLPLSSSDSEST